MTEKKKNGTRMNEETGDDMLDLVDNLNREKDTKFNRRSFIKTAVGASVALGLSTLPISFLAMNHKEEEDTGRVAITKLSSLQKGQTVEFSYPTPADTSILVHTNAGELVAYNNKCTHLQCPVFYEQESERLMCPCHKGYFDVTTGQPLAGPPQRELPLVKIEVVNDTVYAVGREIRHG